MLGASGRRGFVKTILAAVIGAVTAPAKTLVAGNAHGEIPAPVQVAASQSPAKVDAITRGLVPTASSLMPSLKEASGPNFFRSPQVVNLIAKKPMLKGFDKLLYEYIREAIQSTSPITPIYNPYLYESLLSDVAKLLDRCLAYRRECADLEAQAVRRALEFELFEDLYPKALDLQNLATSTTALERQRAASDTASSAFNEAGFKALYKGTAEALTTQETLEGGKRAALEAILKRAKQHQELLEFRHTTPGHALNYTERRDRVIDLLVQDVIEAYQKARGAKLGLEVQLGLKDDSQWPFPVIAGNDSDVFFLDRFVLWARSVAQRYEILVQDEEVFERVIPLVFPWTEDLSGSNPKSVITQATFDNAMGGEGRLIVNIKDPLPTDAQVQRLRVRGIGLSIGVQPPDFWTNFSQFTTRSWSAVVLPPAQRDPYQANPSALLARGTAVLGRVGIYRADLAPEMYSGAGVWNVDPRGEWTIVVDRLMNFPFSSIDATWGTWPRSKALLKDIKLHLRLAGRPSGVPSDWIQPAP
jgi:hypothetical protein